MLDPRFKLEFFVDPFKAKLAKARLVDMLNTMEEEEREKLLANPISTSKSTKRKFGLMAGLEEERESRAAKAPVIEATVSEDLERFLRLPPSSLDLNPIQIWRTLESIFPMLSKLPFKYLSVPATSCASERVFSVTGNIVTQKRTKLTSEHINMLVCLYFARNKKADKNKAAKK